MARNCAAKQPSDPFLLARGDWTVAGESIDLTNHDSLDRLAFQPLNAEFQRYTLAVLRVSVHHRMCNTIFVYFLTYITS
jgi:hypothetical protein